MKANLAQLHLILPLRLTRFHPPTLHRNFRSLHHHHTPLNLRFQGAHYERQPSPRRSFRRGLSHEFPDAGGVGRPQLAPGMRLFSCLP